MKIRKLTKMVFVMALLSATCLGDIPADVFRESNERQTKSYTNELLMAEEYYEAGLKGELMFAKCRKEPLLLSSLKLIGEKPSGITLGGVYNDVNGGIWFVKKGQSLIYEYLGSKVMDLLIGPLSPKVVLLPDAPGYTGSKQLPGFSKQEDVLSDPNHEPIVGEAKLYVAMILMGLADRNPSNLGYINMGNKLEAARVDFDHSFQFETVDRESLTLKDSKALESIVIIPDEMILYVLGSAFNDLWESGISVDYESHKNLGAALLARKHALQKLLPLVFESELLVKKFKNEPTHFTSEDFERLGQVVLMLELNKFSLRMLFR